VIGLEQIWYEAQQDNYACKLDGDGYSARTLFGVKIVFDHATNQVSIYNTTRGGDYYQELTEDLDYFFENGWRYGVYKVAIKNCLFKLDKIELSMRSEVNGKRNPKQIKSLKSARVRVLEKYNYISNKLNSIKND
jgi:hypothetical protein